MGEALLNSGSLGRVSVEHLLNEVLGLGAHLVPVAAEPLPPSILNVLKHSLLVLLLEWVDAREQHVKYNPHGPAPGSASVQKGERGERDGLVPNVDGTAIAAVFFAKTDQFRSHVLGCT